MSSRIRKFALLVSLLSVPPLTLTAAAQESTTAKDTPVCQQTMSGIGEQVMSSGVTPYGMMDALTPGTMMGLGMMDFGLSMSPPDRAVIMEVMQFQPGRVLKLTDQLGLTSDQVASLETLVTAHWTAEHDRRIAMEPAVEKLRALFEAPMPDTTAVRFESEQVVALRNALYVRLVTDGAAVRALLTPAQRNLLLTGPFAPERMSTPHVPSQDGHHGRTNGG